MMDFNTEYQEFGMFSVPPGDLAEHEQCNDNIYLADLGKGLELIAHICCSQRKNNTKKLVKLDNLLDKKLLSVFNDVDLEKELEYYQKLTHISDKLREYFGIRELDNKIIIGVGGMFSAGKSAFLNSLLTSAGNSHKMLEVEQTPTTSIPTFIMKGNEFSIIALKYNGEVLKLSLEEMQALTHKFYAVYKFGFNQYIDKIVITTPDFPYDNLALLDTPGYSKADSSLKQNFTDENRALYQLRSVDFLIWLIDCENGTIKSDDIGFIKKLNYEKPVLVVVNKCDKKPDNESKAIINHIKEVLKENDLYYENILAYSSLYPEKYDAKTLRTFLTKYDNVKNDDSLLDVFSNIITSIDNDLNELIQNNKKQQAEIEVRIREAKNPKSITSLCEYYKYLINNLRDLNYSKKSFENIYRGIFKRLNNG